MTTPTTEEATRTEAVVDETAIAAARSEGSKEGQAEGMRLAEERRAGIEDAVDKLGLDMTDEPVRAIATDLKISEADARAKLIDLRHERANAEKNDTTAAHRTEFEVGEEAGSKVRSAMTSALLHRSDNSQTLAPGAGDFRHMTMLDMARACIRRAGGNPDGHGPSTVLQAALNLRPEGLRFHSTSDFPYVLQDALHKSLLNGYSDEVRNFLPLSTQRNLPDFKESHEISVGSFSDLAEAPEGSELTYGTLSEGEQTWNLVSYRKGLRITRKALINDDMGVFNTLRTRMGAAVARKELDLWWAVITGNLMADGSTSIFSAANANAVLSSGGSPSATNAVQVGAMRTLFRLQTDIDSQLLNLMAKYIIVPAALENDVDKLRRDKVVPITAATTVPEYVSQLVPIVEPRLDSTSSAVWYMAVDPSAWNGMVHGYLAGSEQPQFSSRESWDVQGLEMKVEHDFGTAMVDHRAWTRNVGA